MEEIKQCPICGNEDFKQLLNCVDYFLTKETFNLVSCKNCEFVFVNPRPSQNELSRYYDTPEYISHSGTRRGFVNYLYLKIRNITLKKKFNLVNKVSSGKSILDIGCASGELLNYFKQKNWTTLGIEPDEKARNFSRTNFNLQVEPENHLNNISDKSFDAISMWHVLEHVSELKKRMEQITRIIKDDGTIIIALPNHLSYDAEFYKSYWAAYDVPRHLYHFSQKNIEQLFSNYGFKMISLLPMKFDSYYVSMLSEKYKTGKQSFVKGLYRGYISNLYARKRSNNYSSLIYVFKKK